MSEPNSLYARIHLSAAARDAFLQAPIDSLTKFDDWIEWLQHQQFAGTLTRADIAAIQYRAKTVGEFLHSWIDTSDSHGGGYGFDQYDAGTGEWILSVVEFSENYLDYVTFLQVLRAVQDFKDTDDDDFILIHSCLWGDTDGDVAIRLQKGASRILEDIPQGCLDAADAHLEQRVEKLSEQYAD